MEENNTQNVDESQTQPFEEQTEVEEPQVEAEETSNVPDETDEPAGDNAQIEGGDAPQTSEPEDDEEDDDDITDSATFQVQSPEVVDINNYIDENGNLDLATYQQAQAANTQAIIAAAVQQANAQRQYEKTWDKAYDKYPELRKNSQLRNMVQAIHANSPQTGKYLSPRQAADQLFGIRGAAKQEGIKQAQTTRTVQAAAALGVTNPPAAPQGQGNSLSKLKDTMINGSTLAERNSARESYLKELVKGNLI